jgi:hypothetical protein
LSRLSRLQRLPQRILTNNAYQFMDVLKSAHVHDPGDDPLWVVHGLFWCKPPSVPFCQLKQSWIIH